MTAAVTQLGYVGIETIDPTPWLELSEHIGAEVVEMCDDVFGIRIDSDRAARITVHTSTRQGLAYAGWEVPTPEAFAATVAAVEASGHEVCHRPDLAGARGVEQLATFRDPDDNPGELYWGMSTAIRSRFVSAQGVEFAAGEMGMGHLTLGVQSFEKTHDFYTKALGMQLTEIADVGRARVGFLRCNPRHHSVAFSQVRTGPSRILHVAIEVEHLDDLGAIRDRMLDSGYPIQRDLGRHPTDGVVSLYVRPSDAFDIEIGWGSIHVNDETWERDRYTRIGWSWGHRESPTSGNAPRLGDHRNP